MRLGVQSGVQEPAFPNLLVFDFRLKAISRSQNKQSRSYLLPGACFISEPFTYPTGGLKKKKKKEATWLHLSKRELLKPHFIKCSEVFVRQTGCAH